MTASGLTLISVATAGIAKPVKRLSFIEARSHVFRRRNIENVLSADVKELEFATETLCLDKQKDDTQKHQRHCQRIFHFSYIWLAREQTGRKQVVRDNTFWYSSIAGCI